MPTKCINPYCKISSSFNYENETNFLYCKTHKLEGMINVKAKRTENVDRSIYFCEHKIQKSKCKICDGKSYCEHDKIRIKCVQCHGSQICEHNKIKNMCRDCNGSIFCEHKHRKYDCLLCKGKGICEHSKRKNVCSICSPQRYLVNVQRQNIYRLFNKSETLQKTTHSIEYLGCSIEYFLEYIKSKMTVEMTFQNIHIDHIKPVSLFDLNNEEEFLKCCHYTNIQPLLALDNMNKSNKWSEEDDDFWEDNICNKEYNTIYMPTLQIP